MNSTEARLQRIELLVLKLLKNNTHLTDKWLTEPQTMAVLHVSKRTLAKIRKAGLIRTSCATGRNFKYYRSDVENYLYDHSSINKRNVNKIT
jgi:hypothetical protein